MAVISKEELKKKIAESGLSEDKQIEILEDIEDSWTEDINEEYRSRYEAEKKQMEASIASLEAEAEDLKARYKERFLSGEVRKDGDVTGNISEEKIIDVKEI